jgi:uncharacterized protein YdcH (DUF465 family)
MSSLDEPIKQDLLKSNLEFRSLHEQHQTFENRLEELQSKTLLSEEDELEEKQIKRQKLLLKDRMEAILRACREAGVSA